jgi:hypothetical protein
MRERPARKTEPDKFQKVRLSELRQGRRGKHRDLVEVIASELDQLNDAEAIKIPLNTVNGLSLANLRSAISRAMKSRGVKIATFSDGDSLFVWRKTPGTSRYERKKPR